MKTNTPPFFLVWRKQLAVLAAWTGLLALPAQAQWMGEGVTGGTEGTDFNDESNWIAGSVNGDFTLNDTSAVLTLSDDVDIASFDFRWSASELNLDLNGTGKIFLSGNVFLPEAGTANHYVTIGSGVTLDLGTFSTNRIFNDGTTGRGKLVVNGIMAGSAGEGGAIVLGGHTNASYTLNNQANPFDAPIVLEGGFLNFTSIGDVGGGPSALGAPSTAANGTITLKRNAFLGYTGSTDQSTDRTILFQSLSAGPVGLSHSGDGGTLTYESDMEMGTYSGEFRIRAIKSEATMVLSGEISNTTGATKLIANYGGGVGTVVLTNLANSYLGKTIITKGTLEVTKLANGGSASSIGASSGAAENLTFGDYGDGRGTLRYIGSGDSTDRLFTMLRLGAIIDSSGTGALHFTNKGTIDTGTARPTDTRELTLRGTNTEANSFALLLADHVTGDTVASSRLTKTDAGTWNLTGTESTYTGPTRIQGGVLGVAKLANGGEASSIGAAENAASNLVIYRDATLRYLGDGDSTDRLFQISLGSSHDQSATLEASGSGAINFTNGGNLTYGTANQRRTLILSGTNTGDNQLAATLNNNGNASGVVSLTKTGTGKWAISGNHGYTGATQINAGTLLINGSTDAASAVTVAGGATLGGSGIIHGQTVVDGAIAPGNSIGMLTINNDLTWNGQSGDAWKFELGGVTGVSDSLLITGDFLKGSGLDFQFDFLDTGVVGDFKLVEWEGITGFSAEDFGYTHLQNGLSGSFQIEGSALHFTVTSAIPEPSTWGLAGIGIGLLALGLRRKTRAA